MKKIKQLGNWIIRESVLKLDTVNDEYEIGCIWIICIVSKSLSSILHDAIYLFSRF